MKILKVFAFGFFGSAPFTLGLDQPESYISGHPQDPVADRELFFANQNRCRRDLTDCRAKLEGAAPPTDAWMNVLDSMYETSFASELKEIVAGIDVVDAMHFPSEFLASLEDKDSAELSAQLEPIMEQANQISPFPKWLEHTITLVAFIISAILGILGGLFGLGTPFHIAAQIVTFVAKLIIAFPYGLAGKKGILAVVVSSTIFFVAWLVNLIVKIIFFEGSFRQDEDSLICMGELVQCKHDTYLLSTIPTLAGAVFLADSLEM